MDVDLDLTRALVDTLPDVVFASDAAGRLKYLNAAWTALTGHPVAESLGTSLGEHLELGDGEITHPDDLAAEVVQWERLATGEIRDYDIEMRLLRPDGDVVWTRQTVAFVRDPAGKPLYAVSQLHDVTAARRAAER